MMTDPQRQLDQYIVPVGHINSKLSSVYSKQRNPVGRYSTPLAKPNPSVSNKGLVIVQETNPTLSSYIILSKSEVNAHFLN